MVLTRALFTSGTPESLQALYDQFEQELEDAFAVLTPSSDYPAQGWQLTPDTSVDPEPHYPDSLTYSPAPFQYSPHPMASIDAVPVPDSPGVAAPAAVAAIASYHHAIPNFPHLKDEHGACPKVWVRSLLDTLSLQGPDWNDEMGTMSPATQANHTIASALA